MLVEVVLGVLLLGLVWLSFFRKPQGLPPGRWGLPMIGYIPLTTKSMMDQIKDLHKQHGDIYLLPYTEAAIQETLRLSTLVPYGLQHMASQDLQLGGYLIPKGTVVSTVPLTVHHDPRYWECPEKFMPERWLDQDGKFNPRKDGFLPFGIGKRACLGESLARMELLIFITTVFQSLTFAPPQDGPLDLTGNPDQMPFFNSPRKQGICITLRGEREGQMG